MTPLLREIYQWSLQLPDWQSDAVARLLERPKLTDADKDDLLALLKLAQGIPDPKARVAKPLTDDLIPVPVQDSVQIVLTSIENLRNVNAIAQNQSLPISATGLTVIYGDNGSGKSGYSRVLKRACRARDQSEVILPDASRPEESTGKAEADFRIACNAVERIVHWIDDATSPAELSALAIFDSRCANDYLISESDFSYKPYGLHVFEGLANLCTELKRRIEEELVASKPDVTPFLRLRGMTKVGVLILNLSADTPADDIESLAAITNDEGQRYHDLAAGLREADPKAKAGQLRRTAARVTDIASSLAATVAQLDESAVGTLRVLTENVRNAEAAADLAAKQFKEGGHFLPGTGGLAWRELFEAARRFSLESHPDHSFPDLGTDAACPLCQQPLGEGAARLEQFEMFVQQEAAKVAQNYRSQLTKEVETLGSSNPVAVLDDATRDELKLLDALLVSEIQEFQEAAGVQRDMLLAAVQSNDWDGVEKIIACPTNRLQSLAETLLAEAEVLESVANLTQRQALEREFCELEARIQLQGCKDLVLATVAKFQHERNLQKCITALKTKAISLKASELTTKVTSDDLASALDREFKDLGVKDLRVSFGTRADRGKALHKLKLETPGIHGPSDILSEGEQRAIAIACFLAEVSLYGGMGGVVLDDPISSLDHRRRDRVAKRLAAEALRRQVILFTHDIYFLCTLIEEAELAGVPYIAQSLTKRPAGFGVADPELPFEGKNTPKRIGALRAQHQTIAQLHRNGEEKEWREETLRAYDQLRKAWERAIEEVLFQKVVLRFRQGVETNRLRGVVVDDDDYAQVHAGMSKCSKCVHDRAVYAGASLPHPDELLKDIEALDNWRSHVEKKSGDVAKRRKKG